MMLPSTLPLAAALLCVTCATACADGSSASPGEGEGEGDVVGEGEGDVVGEGEGDVVGEGEGDVAGEGEGEDAPPLGVYIPDAPSPARFAWQGSQDHMTAQSVDGGGGPPTVCDAASVVVALSERALCFVSSDDELLCAGQVGAVNDPVVDEARFVPMGVEGVRQIVLSVSGDLLCVRKSDGTAWCIGTETQGLANTSDGLPPLQEWKRWGTRSDIAELATGTMDQLCARYADDTAECAGLFCGVRPDDPQSCPTSPDHDNTFLDGVQSLWLDTAGMARINEGDIVFRVSNSRTSCSVVPEGLACNDALDAGTGGAPALSTSDGWFLGYLVTPPELAGHVVDGGMAALGEPSEACWLDDRGRFECVVYPSPITGNDAPVQSRYFALPGRAVISLAVTGYSFVQTPGAIPSRCAALSDGSLWCIGDNLFGQLAVDDAALFTETQVSPPGSVRIDCPVVIQ